MDVYCECITVGGLLSTCTQMFHSDLEITALPHTNTSFLLSRFLSLASHNASVILIVFIVKLHYINDFTGCKIMHAAWLRVVNNTNALPL